MNDERFLVHIVDDDAADRAIGDAILHGHGFPTRIWPSTADFLAAVAEAEPGCVLIDFGAQADATSVMALLKRKPRILPTIILGRHDNIVMAIEVLKAGAIDFLEKPLDPPILIAAVDRALRYLVDKRHRNAAMRNAQRLIETLSPRELDVLHSLIRGASNKITARDLNISARTVEIHRAKIMSKLGVTSLPMVMHVAYFAGLFRPGDEYFAIVNTLGATESYV